MTKEIEDKIYNQYPNPEGLSDILFETRKINAAKRTGARYGFSLAETELAEKNKEIERLKNALEFIKKMTNSSAIRIKINQTLAK